MRLHDASSWREATFVQYSMTENVTDSTSKLYLRREVTHATGAATWVFYCYQNLLTLLTSFQLVL